MVGAVTITAPGGPEKGAAAAPAADPSARRPRGAAFSDHLKRAADKRDREKLLAACRAFETFFLNELLGEMRRTLPRGGLFDAGFAGDVYQGLLDWELAEKGVDAGGVGLADMLYRELSGGSNGRPA